VHDLRPRITITAAGAIKQLEWGKLGVQLRTPRLHALLATSLEVADNSTL
jgi:hypothetical protein